MTPVPFNSSEKQTPFDFQGKDTGRTAVEAGGTLVVEMVSKDETAPLWRETLGAGSSRMFSQEIDDQTIRKTMLDSLARQLLDLDLPYFLPKSEDLMALPAVVE